MGYKKTEEKQENIPAAMKKKKHRGQKLQGLGYTNKKAPNSRIYSLQRDQQLTVCSYHVTYAFQSESTLYSCLNVKDLLARNRREI